MTLLPIHAISSPFRMVIKGVLFISTLPERLLVVLPLFALHNKQSRLSSHGHHRQGAFV